jgi:membrane protein required for colicin V production
MAWLDYAVLGVFAVSMLWGAWRGLVGTVVSIAGWVMAFLAAHLFAGPLAEAFPDLLPTPPLRIAAAFAAIFIGTLIFCSLVGWLLSRIVKAIGLGALDTALGTVLGGARAVLILLAAALLAGLTSLPREAFWKSSVSGPLLGDMVRKLRPVLPAPLAESLRYD